MQNFHSIEANKERKRQAYSSTLRKSQWEDLSMLQTQKLAVLMNLSQSLQLYSAKNHADELQVRLDNNAEYQSLIKLTLQDLASIAKSVETIGSQHKQYSGKIGMDELPSFLRISELYMDLDNKLDHIHNGTLATLSEIFSQTIENIKAGQ